VDEVNIKTYKTTNIKKGKIKNHTLLTITVNKSEGVERIMKMLKQQIIYKIQKRSSFYYLLRGWEIFTGILFFY